MPTVLPPGVTWGAATPTRGRSVSASRAFGPGEVIATFDGPCISIPENSHMARTCSHCLKTDAVEIGSMASGPSPTMRACTGCHTARYCSPECQRANWKLVHGKGECKAFQASRRFAAEMGTPDIIPTPVRALIQALARTDIKEGIAELEGHFVPTSKRNQKAWFDFTIQARAALHYMGREDNEGSMKEATETGFRLQVNSFNASDADLGESGFYTNVALAMVNHSCIPNTYVEFKGRKALLRAYRAIEENEEVLISYIDTTLPRSHRQQALKEQYHFTCLCPRCKNDLDIYQVCQLHPPTNLNTFTLNPDPETYRNPLVDRTHLPNLQRHADEIYDNLKAAPLSERWRRCTQLRKARAYAVEPLTSTIVDASLYLGEKQNLMYGLVLSCFIALHSDPYRDPMPFCATRLKGLYMIAKLISHTASMVPTTATDTSDGTTTLKERVERVLGGLDQVTVYQVVLKMIVRHSLAGHSVEWELYRQAREMLEEIEGLKGRDAENALVDAFATNPGGVEEERFFKTAVLEPIWTLAGFAMEIMGDEFDR